MARRTYEQFCPVARALEIIGDRWALAIVRNLIVAPKRFTDLRRGLPGIPSNILTVRLKKLENVGVVARRSLSRTGNSVVYELTGYGRELEPVVLRLGLWGVHLLRQTRPDEIVTSESLIIAMRATFRPAASQLPVTYEVRYGDVVIHLKISAGILHVASGPLATADLVIDTGPGLRALMAREITPAEAIRDGSVRLQGDVRLLDRFVETFYIPPMPSSVEV